MPIAAVTPVIASHAGSTWLTGLTGLSPCVGPVANGMPMAQLTV